MYTRHSLADGSWTEWKKVWNSGNFDPDTKAPATLVLSGGASKCYKIGSWVKGANRYGIFEIRQAGHNGQPILANFIINTSGNIAGLRQVSGSINYHVYLRTYDDGTNINFYLYSEASCSAWELHAIKLSSTFAMSIQDMGTDAYVPSGTLVCNTRTGEGATSSPPFWNNKAVVLTDDTRLADARNPLAHNHGAGDITSGVLSVARGGTGLGTAPSLLTNLASASAASILSASPRPGVTGILGVGNGGTGKSVTSFDDLFVRGTANVVVGPSAGGYGTGTYNSALGQAAGMNNTTGEHNAFLGAFAGRSNTTGSDNVYVGYEAGANYNATSGNTTGSNNVFVGSQAGRGNQSGGAYSTVSASVFLGAYSAVGPSDSMTNIQCLGFNSSASASNQVVLGNLSITSLKCNVQTISSYSDIRIKEDVQGADTSMCLDAVLSLPVIRYKYKDFVGTKLDNHVTGWLADDVEKVFPKAVQVADERFMVLGEDGNQVYETVMEQVPDGVDEDGNEIFREETREVPKTFMMEAVKNITMTEAVPTLWGAVQELAKEIQELKEMMIA